MRTKSVIGLLTVAATLCAALMPLMPLPGARGYAVAATYE
jgi:hypothetical protein